MFKKLWFFEIENWFKEGWGELFQFFLNITLSNPTRGKRVTTHRNRKEKKKDDLQSFFRQNLYVLLRWENKLLLAQVLYMHRWRKLCYVGTSSYARGLDLKYWVHHLFVQLIICTRRVKKFQTPKNFSSSLSVLHSKRWCVLNTTSWVQPPHKFSAVKDALRCSLFDFRDDQVSV